jgi:tetratricopeptide (TPR) repeat protein
MRGRAKSGVTTIAAGLLAVGLALSPHPAWADGGGPVAEVDDPTAARGDAYARLMRSLFAARRGEFRAAVTEIRKSIELQPDSPQVYVQGAELLLDLRMYSEAELMVRRALEVAPDDPEALRFLADMVSRRALRAGEVPDAAATGEALQLYGRLADVRPLDEDSQRQVIQLRLRLGDYDGAIGPTRELLLQRPGDAEALRTLAGLLVQQGRTRDALDEILRFIVGHPDESVTIEDADRLASDLDAWGTVAEVLVEGLGDDPTPAHALLGEALLRLGRVDDAIDALERALAANSSGRRVRLRLVLAYRSQGRLADSTVLASSLASESPDQPELQFLLAETLQAQRNIDASLDSYQHTLEMLSNDEAQTAPTFRDRVRRRMAQLAAATERFEMADVLLDSLESSDDVNDLLLRARSAVMREDWGAARSVVKRLRAQGADGEAAQVQGEVFARTGRDAKAEPRFDEAVRLLGPQARLSIAQTYRELGFDDRGEALMRAGVEEDPEAADASFDLGRYFYTADRFDEMETAMRESFRLEPDHAPALNFLGYSLAERNERLDEALELIQRALAVDAWDGAYLDSLGWVYFQMGLLDDARGPLERAAREYPTDPVILEHLGDVYQGLGEERLALSAWSRAADAGPAGQESIRAKIQASEDRLADSEDSSETASETLRPDSSMRP